MSVFGGKITTYRKLAQTAVDMLVKALGVKRPAWTESALLPGGDLTGGSFARFLRNVERRYPWLPEHLRNRYSRAYGTRIDHVIGRAGSLADLGEEVVPQLHEREIEYLQREEWAVTAEDILWRRSKLGLHVPASAATRLSSWLEASGAAMRRGERQNEEA
jgi:glycerol-3-phosphate dehydrogenase